MSLPENPYDEIDHDYRVTVARDKDWAEWILEELMPNTEYKTINTMGDSMAVSDNGFLRIEDFEALKKLAGKE